MPVYRIKQGLTSLEQEFADDAQAMKHARSLQAQGHASQETVRVVRMDTNGNVVAVGVVPSSRGASQLGDPTRTVIHLPPPEENKSDD